MCAAAMVEDDVSHAALTRLYRDARASEREALEAFVRDEAAFGSRGTASSSRPPVNEDDASDDGDTLDDDALDDDDGDGDDDGAAGRRRGAAPRSAAAAAARSKRLSTWFGGPDDAASVLDAPQTAQPAKRPVSKQRPKSQGARSKGAQLGPRSQAARSQGPPRPATADAADTTAARIAELQDDTAKSEAERFKLGVSQRQLERSIDELQASTAVSEQRDQAEAEAVEKANESLRGAVRRERRISEKSRGLAPGDDETMPFEDELDAMRATVTAMRFKAEASKTKRTATDQRLLDHAKAQQMRVDELTEAVRAMEAELLQPEPRRRVAQKAAQAASTASQAATASSALPARRRGADDALSRRSADGGTSAKAPNAKAPKAEPRRSRGDDRGDGQVWKAASDEAPPRPYEAALLGDRDAPPSDGGRREVRYKNGTCKTVKADGAVVVRFANGDEKRSTPAGVVIYYYAEAQTTHTTDSAARLEVFEFPNGQVERHHGDGSKEISFPDGTQKTVDARGRSKTVFPDGAVVFGDHDQ